MEIVTIDQQIAADKIAASPYDEFQRVGHSVFALLAGMIGGIVATWFYARRERSEAAG
jgi:hypothetical protein